MDWNFDHQMSLNKSKCWYSNNCLCFLKRSAPFNKWTQPQGSSSLSSLYKNLHLKNDIFVTKSGEVKKFDNFNSFWALPHFLNLGVSPFLLFSMELKARDHYHKTFYDRYVVSLCVRHSQPLPPLSNIYQCQLQPCLQIREY
jgi:hypothetical protein